MESSWQVWMDRHAGCFGQFVTLSEVRGIVDAAPDSLRRAPLHQDALCIGAYMRSWLDSFQTGTDDDLPTPPWIENDTGEDPVMEFSKMVGFLATHLTKSRYKKESPAYF